MSRRGIVLGAEVLRITGFDGKDNSMFGVVCGPYISPELLDSYRVAPHTEKGVALKNERERQTTTPPRDSRISSASTGDPLERFSVPVMMGLYDRQPR